MKFTRKSRKPDQKEKILSESNFAEYGQVRANKKILVDLDTKGRSYKDQKKTFWLI